MSEEKAKMNVYEKIAKARTLVKVTKNGINQHAQYKSYKLEDIYIEAKKVFFDLGLVTKTSIKKIEGGDLLDLPLKYKIPDPHGKVDKWGKIIMIPAFEKVNVPLFGGTLTVINVDNPTDTMIFELDMPYSQQDGSSFAQSMGGTATYVTKYLYQALLMLDDTQDDDVTNKHGEDSKEDDTGNGEDPKAPKEPVTPQKPKQTKQTPEPKQDSAEETYKQKIAKTLTKLGYDGKNMLVFIEKHCGSQTITEQQAHELWLMIDGGDIDIPEINQ